MLFCVLCCPSGCAWEWDNLTCWQAASVGEIVVVSCPELFEFMSPGESEWFFLYEESELFWCILCIIDYYSIESCVEVCESDYFWLFRISGLGKISRNCTEYGWSEPYPQYVDACLPKENSTKPVCFGWNVNHYNTVKKKSYTKYKVSVNSASQSWIPVGYIQS